MRLRFSSFIVGLLALLVSSPALAAEQYVTVYTARYKQAEKVLYKIFEEKTGITVKVVEGKPGDLLKRIQEEGENTEADLFATVDGTFLASAKGKGLSQPMPKSRVLGIPDFLRDAEYHWIALSYRARVIVYAKDRVDPASLSTYEDLADPRWKGRIVMRPGNAQYNRTLLASLITLNGEEAAASFVSGLVANFARPAKGNDRDQAKDIAAGVADISVMNTYYIGQMLASSKPEEAEAAGKIGVFFPNQHTTGTHYNVNGVLLTKHAKNTENALRLVEFLISPAAQGTLTELTYEYPANEKTAKPALLQSFGDFKIQQIDFAQVQNNSASAARLAKEAGW